MCLCVWVCGLWRSSDGIVTDQLFAARRPKFGSLISGALEMHET